MTNTDDPLSIALALAEALESAGIDYAIGGALAYGVWADPRGTLDVDLNVFVSHEQFPRALEVLERAGVSVNRSEALRADERGDVIVGWYGPVRIDLFTPSVPFAWEAARTARSVAGPVGSARFLSPEAIAVFKMLFFRPKDRLDVERLIKVQGDALDVGYVRRWLVEMMGEDDERVAALDAMLT